MVRIKRTNWRDVPVRNVEDAVGRSLGRNAKRKVTTMAAAFVDASVKASRKVS